MISFIKCHVGTALAQNESCQKNESRAGLRRHIPSTCSNSEVCFEHKFRGVNILSRILRVFTMQRRFPKEKRVKINGVITDHVSILQSAGTAICKPIDFDMDLNN